MKNVPHCKPYRQHARDRDIAVGVPGVTHEVGKDHRDKKGADETLDRLLRAELDELVTTEQHAAHVGCDVVDDDERDRDPEPDHALAKKKASGRRSGERGAPETYLEDVVHDKVARDDDEEEGHVDPAKQAELATQAVAVQGRDEADKACAERRSVSGRV